MPISRMPHPVGFVLAWREPLTPSQRKYREFTVAWVRGAVAEYDTLSEAATELGTRYETLARWRRRYDELKTTEELRAELAGHDRRVIRKARKSADSPKGMSGVS